MNGINLLIDTNIALYLLNGNKSLIGVLNRKNLFVSFISELELLGYKNISEKEKRTIQNFLNDCTIIDCSSEIKITTINLKQKYNIKLPDALIAATAKVMNMTLLSADTGFNQIQEIDFQLFNP